MLAGDRFELFLLLIDDQGNVIRKKNILGLTNLSFDFFISNIFNVFEMSDGSIVILGQTSGNNRSTRLFAYRTQFN